MKIGFVTNLFPPIDRGGAEQVVWRIAHELHARGHDVFVLSTTPFKGASSVHPHVSERHIQKVYRFYPLNIYHVLNDHRYPKPIRALWHWVDLFSPVPRKVVRNVLKKEKPDIVFSHNFKGLGMQAGRAIENYDALHVHTVHDVQLSIPSGLMIYGEENARFNSSRLRGWYEQQVQRAIGSPDVVLSPSQFLADFYTDRGFFEDSDLRVLPNPAPNIKVPEFSARDERKKLRLLYAGQLEEHKGVEFLLKVLNDAEIPIELHVAGNGSLADYVTDWKDKDVRVTYHGFVSLEKLVQLFLSCDGVVVPSLCYENSPTIIYEAFQAGVPVVASDIGGVGELVDDGENGYLFEPGNKHDLLQKLNRLADNADGLFERGDEIRKQMEKYSLNRYAESLARIVDEKME
jgi:glycosyltransferase involved in cell wall biosynthesis